MALFNQLLYSPLSGNAITFRFFNGANNSNLKFPLLPVAYQIYSGKKIHITIAVFSLSTIAMDVTKQNLAIQLQFINITTIQIFKLIAHFYSIFT